MRRKHEFGHGDLVSVTEKEKATSLATFFSQSYLYKICLFDSNNLTIKKDIYIQTLIQYKYVIVDRYLFRDFDSTR